tara:strand:+ start:562 stop:675 length:114 start_codon:yes stop_codon:yes gene_type:complete
MKENPIKGIIMTEKKKRDKNIEDSLKTESPIKPKRAI